MTRNVIQDAAVAAAKAWSHPAVESRHVLYAICRTYQKRAELQSVLSIAKAALNPFGSSVATPAVSDEARSLLDECKSEEAAVTLAARLLKGDAGSGLPPATGIERAQALGEPSAPPPPAVAKSAEDLQVILGELDGLVGLASVKNQVRELIAVVQANEQRRKAGLPAINPSLHLVFRGSPGTGKTTIARLVARLYAAVGVLAGSQLLEATRADLVAGYVGQTAIKTKEVIERARPGVLFIDEAYSLAASHGSDFSHECVSTLVKCMEDHRADLAVIAAGYQEEMDHFIASNPGLRSRFKTYITFPDYSSSELTQIFENFAKDTNISLAPGVLERAGHLFSEGAKTQAFGNARFVRSTWEHAYGRMAVRAAQDGKIELHELQELIPDDLPPVPPTRVDRRRIGYR